MLQFWRRIRSFAIGHKALMGGTFVGILTTIGVLADGVSLIDYVCHTLCSSHSDSRDLQPVDKTAPPPDDKKRPLREYDYAAQVTSNTDRAKTLKYLNQIAQKYEVPSQYKRDIIPALVNGAITHRGVFHVANKIEANEFCSIIIAKGGDCFVLPLEKPKAIDWDRKTSTANMP